MAETKDFWDKLDIALKPIGPVVAAILVGVIGWMGRGYLEHQTNARLLAEILSQRERADTSLRAEMFGKIIEEFLTSSPDLARDVLNLEILAQNFHETFDIGPLFKAVHSDIVKTIDHLKLNDTQRQDDNPALKRNTDLLSRLETASRDVISQQVNALKAGRNSIDWKAHSDVVNDPDRETVFESVSQQEVLDYFFNVEILRIYEEKREVFVKMIVWSKDDAGKWTFIDPTFSVGLFDFPMIDNTRLPGGERCAVVVNNFRDGVVEMELVVFPSSRASLKDRPYIEDVIKQLLEVNRISDYGNLI